MSCDLGNNFREQNLDRTSRPIRHKATTCINVDNFQDESLIVNADSSKGKGKQYLAAGTFNENVIKEFSLQTTK